MLIPPRLKAGDEIRVIAPSNSAFIISAATREEATRKLNNLGLKVTFSKNFEEKDEFNSSSVTTRLNALHDAFADQNVGGILTVKGGFNSNQLLKKIDYNLVRRNAKIFCGYSDITALSNAIYKKCNFQTYIGPHYSTFGIKKDFDYILDHFVKFCFHNTNKLLITPSTFWSNDAWYLDQENRKFIKNEGYSILNHGSAIGTLIGGNLNTLVNLNGTEFMPDFDNAIMCLEVTVENTPQNFDAMLVSLILQPNFEQVKGILIGRFEKASEISLHLLRLIISSKEELNNIPVICGLDFGHTEPQLTIPLGGTCEIVANVDDLKIYFSNEGL
ncbi:hypothetical protein HK099_004511 [Clydaea vesicula]|uniref:LD-carboxypeptidase n=1 Tax=Clydaea vesicula TaxID=447962 RepID=A0AAD5Y303_9FUNG|nr:hypothetical protein HK099_004511 [Clydaea vesicula]KAJ3392893.1 hypothetical protein HDU92_008115 [Lobulomyces angularis]